MKSFSALKQSIQSIFSIPSSQSPKNEAGFGVIILLLAGLLLLGVGAGGGYLVLNTVNKPERIKSSVQPTQTAFESYNSSISDIIEYLEEEDSNSDSESIERSIQKSKGYVSTAETALTSLKDANMKLGSDTKIYKEEIEKYVTTAQPIFEKAKHENTVGEQMVPLIKEMEKMNSDLSGVANYMYSDPDKYISLVNEYIKKQEEILTKFKAIKTEGETKEEIDNAIKLFEAASNFLKDVVKAVENRDNEAMVQAQKAVSQKSEDLQKQTNRLKDTRKEKLKQTKKELESIEKKINDEYQSLKNEYKF